MSIPGKIGKYEIHNEIGKGAVGTVYRAFDPHISRQVAIKVIVKASLAPIDVQHMISRFRHEAQAVGRLVHPRIVQIYDYGEDDELAYIVMELVNGKSLQEHLKKGANYTPKEVLEIIRPLLDAFSYVHGEGVVHRDLKPSNIMINIDGRIKVCDFGIAHTESSELTQMGDILGSLHYMSPEQFTGGAVDERSDLYSVGVIAYELLAGKKPFTGNSAAMMQQVMFEEPAFPSSINPKLTPQIDQVILKSMCKDRENRYQTAREFADDFIHAIATLGGDTNSAADALPQPHSISGAPRSQSPAGLLNAARMINAQSGAAQLTPTGTLIQPRSTSALKSDGGFVPEGAIPRETQDAQPDNRLDNATADKEASIVVVDDEERILTALKSLFRTRYNVFSTTDGRQALDHLKNNKVQVIISDQRMPIMPGVEVLRQAREISPATVRILLTGYSDLASIAGSINEGEVYRFISKPWYNEELQQTVAEAVTISNGLAEASTSAIELPSHIDAGILVVDPDEESLRLTKGVMSGLCPIHHASNLDAALAAMQQHEIAVVLADIGSGNDEIAAMIKLLKQENPQILTIVLTAASDSDLMIDLINQAQIFRFLNKPVKVNLLKRHLYSALAQYLKFRESPQWLEQQRVQQSNLVRETTIGQKILDSFLSFRLFRKE